jgi:uncharacterized RDD family membrane protein YckC
MEDQILDSSLSQQDGQNPAPLTYSTFGSRFAAALVDGLVVGAISVTATLLNGISKNVLIATAIIQIAFSLFYHVYLVQLSGATPGKRVMNLKIVKLDGSAVTWNEAILRQLPQILLAIVTQAITVSAVLTMDQDYYDELSWLQRMQIGSTNPLVFQVIQWVSVIWSLADIITFFTNDERRALHDKIAGTVVISTQ